MKRRIKVENMPIFNILKCLTKTGATLRPEIIEKTKI